MTLYEGKRFHGMAHFLHYFFSRAQTECWKLGRARIAAAKPAPGVRNICIMAQRRGGVTGVVGWARSG